MLLRVAKYLTNQNACIYWTYKRIKHSKYNKGKTLIITRTYSIDEVMNAMGDPDHRGKYGVLPDGRRFKRSSQRLKLFSTMGTSCITCGIEGTIFRLESHHENVPPHLNLYCEKDGDFILMTKDHIYPKSLGGPNIMSNYAPMCSPCNRKKGSSV